MKTNKRLKFRFYHVSLLELQKIQLIIFLWTIVLLFTDSFMKLLHLNMQAPMNPSPPFMNGLLTARNVLLSLHQRKVKDQKDKQSRPRDENHDQYLDSPSKVKKLQPQKPLQQIQHQPNLSKRQQLTQTINEIGQQLSQVHQENQTYDSIFHQMTEYYRENHKIVEDNQRHKRKSFQLEEKIKEFKDKIKENYDKIELSERQSIEIHTLLEEFLEEYLRSERERAMVEPLKIPYRGVGALLKDVQPAAELSSNEHKEQNQQGSTKISLDWRSLAQKTAKKAVARKPKGSEDVHQYLFNSELYIYNI